MDDQFIIEKNRKLPPSQDFEFLRSEGLKYIESLSHELWTDYNTHDPGITILEALCYAITELGYRSGFEMKDLLTDRNGNIYKSQNFFTAKKILTNNSLTINDYRKLLIDLEGVHNAFLFAEDRVFDIQGNEQPVSEIAIYADCKKDKLQLEPPTVFTLFPNGLYRVLLDLEYDDRYGDLNSGDIIIPNPKTGNFEEGEFLLSIELPSWKEADLLFCEKAKVKNNLASTDITNEKAPWNCVLKLTDSSSTDLSTMQFFINAAKNPASKKVTANDIKAMFNVNRDETTQFIASIFDLYIDKIKRAKEIVQSAIKKLHEHRNLCEDFLEVTTVDNEEVAFCFDVDVKPDSDIEKIQAEIFYVIENYLNPSVDFYSLKEMLDKKIPVDNIFEGPALNNGFIETGQLERTNLRTVIHTSDIINLLMDIKGMGIISIRNFMMTKYDKSGKALSNFVNLKWCMDITPFHKPVLSVDKSKILLFKNQFPFLARYDEVKDTIRLLHAQKSRSKLKGLDNDIPVQPGEIKDTKSYWPVQYDFPKSYGIGEFGLPSTAAPQRVAQQRQLKAYLMFYEQLLADFFSQLSNAYKLFSIEDIKQTYFARFLKEIKDIDPIYNLNTPAGNLEEVIKNPDSTSDKKTGWQNLYESKNLFEDRRNRFLDHLLARFAESFNDYALLTYKMNYEKQTEEKIDFHEVAAAKILTLKNYDDISSQRGKAYNYFPQNKNDKFETDSSKLWDTDNVAGIEKRISFLSSIEDYTRRFLNCIKNITIECKEKIVEKDGKKNLKSVYNFSITSFLNPNEKLKLFSRNYDKKDKAEKAVLDTIESAKIRGNYQFKNKRLLLFAKSNDLLMESEKEVNEESANAHAGRLTEEFLQECDDPVGLHLVEHILLRPRSKDFGLLSVCLHECDCLCDIDPYSFQASVILPYWPGHFDNIAFRKYFENKIREEAPAHIKLKIFWLNNDLMREFEICYKNWIESLADYYFNKEKIDELKIANNGMIDILSRLHSEYPKATLHSCIESQEGSNVVVLGKTVLGTYKE